MSQTIPYLGSQSVRSVGHTSLWRKIETAARLRNVRLDAEREARNIQAKRDAADREARSQRLRRSREIRELRGYHKGVRASKEMFRTRQRAFNILCEVAAKHGVSIEVIRSRNRYRNVCLARGDAAYRMYTEVPRFSLTHVAKEIGNIDHTTALYHIRKHAERNGLPIPCKTNAGRVGA